MSLACAVVLGCSSAKQDHAPVAGSASGDGGAGGSGGAAIGSGGLGGASGAMGGSGGGAGMGGEAGTAINMTAGQGGASATGEHCREAAPQDIHDDPATYCRNYESVHDLPNMGATYARGFALPSAMIAGEPYTVSLDAPHSGAHATYEIWGTEGQCGAIGELLYWTEATEGPFCATFTPTAAHTGIMFVRRTLAYESGASSSWRAVAFCGAAGSCPSGSQGHALAPGVVLEPPIGGYPVSTAQTTSILTRDYLIDVTGRIVLRVPELNTTGSPIAIAHGLFRMSPADAFGDAWYCMGEGSTLTLHDDGDTETLALRNITRATCPAAASGALALEPAGDGQALASSFPELMTSAPVPPYSLSCEWKECRLYYAPSEAADVMATLTLDTNIGTNAVTPTGPMPLTTDPVGVAGAFVITAPTDGSAMRYACGTAGSLQLNSGSSAYHVELTGLSDFAGCPGEPLVDDSFDLTLLD